MAYVRRTAVVPGGLIHGGAACFMQYGRKAAHSIENSRRIERAGAYCIEKSEIYAIRARFGEMS